MSAQGVATSLLVISRVDSPDGAVGGGGGVPVGVQHSDVQGRGADRETVESRLPASEPVLHPRRRQVFTTHSPHRDRHYTLLPQRLGRHSPRQDQVG